MAMYHDGFPWDGMMDPQRALEDHGKEFLRAEREYYSIIKASATAKRHIKASQAAMKAALHAEAEKIRAANPVDFLALLLGEEQPK